MSKEGAPLPQHLTLTEVVRAASMDLLRDGQHAPTIILEGSLQLVKGEMSDFPRTHVEKLQRMRAAGFLMAHAGDIGEPEQVFFIFEGWMSMGHEDKPPHLSPSEDPNRIEA